MSESGTVELAISLLPFCVFLQVRSDMAKKAATVASLILTWQISCSQISPEMSSMKMIDRMSKPIEVLHLIQMK